MKKEITLIACGIVGITLLTGCGKDKFVVEGKAEDTLYEYVNDVSADAQFESVLGLAVEQPLFDVDNKKIGKRLFIESSREKVTKSSLIKFYSEVSPHISNYKEIVIGFGDKKAVQIFLDTKEIWKCSIDENMTLVKEEQIEY